LNVRTLHLPRGVAQHTHGVDVMNEVVPAHVYTQHFTGVLLSPQKVPGGSIYIQDWPGSFWQVSVSLRTVYTFY